MVTEALKTLFERDLDKLIKEIEAYKSEASLWKIDKEISNPGGNLALHLIGNLNFMSSLMGGPGYVRNREMEFIKKNVPKAELIASIRETKKIVSSTLEQLPEDQLKKEFPHNVFEQPVTTEFMLIHLTTHLSYHLGQINYHRRMLDV